ncbi:hypothetical protein ACFFRR_010265 [Megaselia abdita]
MENDENTRVSMNSTKIYNVEWEKLPTFKGWLINGDKGILFAKCQVCDRHLRAQRNDIYKHSQSIKHKNNMIKEGMMISGEDLPDYPIKRLCSSKSGQKRPYNSLPSKRARTEFSRKNPLHVESDEGSSFAFEVVEKIESNDYSDQEVVEYLTEEQVEIEEYDESSQISEEILDEEDDRSRKTQFKQSQSPVKAITTTGSRSSLFTESECEIFGVFIANEMKGFDFRKRKVFKKQVLQLLIEMEDD